MHFGLQFAGVQESPPADLPARPAEPLKQGSPPRRPRGGRGKSGYLEKLAKADAARCGIALITANFGGIDTIRPFPTALGVDTYYYTEAERIAETDPTTLASWTRVIAPDYPRHDFAPRLRAKYFKLQIHRLPEAEPYRWLAWADANVQFRDPWFLLRGAMSLAELPPQQRMALLAHPERTTVREEYEFVAGRIAQGDNYLRLRYAREKMAEQMRHFAERGWNLDAPLRCGTVWLVENSELIRRCWDAWWDQNLRYGMMDQLLLPVILDAFGLEPQLFGFDITKNRYFEWGLHRVLM